MIILIMKSLTERVFPRPLLAYQHFLQLGRTLVRRLQRKYAGIQDCQSGTFRQEFHSSHAWLVFTDQNTTLGEMEWMLARAAGYDAGFAMVARPKSIKANPIGEQLLDAIREWETARLSSAFQLRRKQG